MSGKAKKKPDARADEKPNGPLLRHASRTRAALFLCLNLLAYAFAAAFVHFLCSGRWFSTTAAAYHESISRPLGQMFTAPLGVFSHPWMILVDGLLLTAIIIVPLLVACLYHSRFCSLFLVCVAVLAHAPVLTLVLAAGCVLVAATPLRRRNPSLALLAGLVPVGAYLFLSARPSTIVTPPLQQFVLYLPFVIAAAGSVVAGGVVLLIAHWVKYRPGVIWPVVTVLVAAPVWLFYRQVGADELDFALLAGKLTPSETVFASEAASTDGGPLTRKRIEHVLDRLKQRKAAMVRRCDRFLKDYPHSPRRPAVLWIKGVTLDTQVSRRALEGGLLRYYDDYPLPASESTWRTLAEEHPRQIRSAVALFRLAHLAGREGDIPQMRRCLEAAAALLTDIHAAAPKAPQESVWAELFTPDPGWPSRAYLQRVAVEVEKLLWLVDRNGVEGDPEAAEAFRAFVSLDPRRYGGDDFSHQIMFLLERYVHTPLADNFELADMRDIRNARTRAMRLKVLENEPGSDASIEANFELGLLALEMDNVEGLNRILQRPDVYFRRVTSAVANPWQRRASEYLAELTVQEGAAR